MVLFCTNRNKSEFEMCYQKQILWSSSRFRSSYILNYCYHNALQNTNTSEVSSWRKQIQHKKCYFSGVFFSILLNIKSYPRLHKYVHVFNFDSSFHFYFLLSRRVLQCSVSCSICIFWKETTCKVKYCQFRTQVKRISSIKSMLLLAAPAHFLKAWLVENISVKVLNMILQSSFMVSPLIYTCHINKR